jgi:hypothetical protein
MRPQLTLLALLAVTVGGCAKADEFRCPAQWNGRSNLSADFSHYTRVKFPRVSTHLIANVDYCYAQRPYIRAQNYLSFTDELVSKDGDKIVLFDIAGVSDIAMGVTVGQNNQIRDMGLVPLSSVNLQ